MFERKIYSLETEDAERCVRIIREVQQHSFEFGYRHAFTTGKARIYTPDGGWTWRMNVPAPKVNEVWHGNCVQDVLLSAEVLRAELPDSMVSIQYLDADGLGNASWSQDHFRIFVEDTRYGIMASVDHSPFHLAWFNSENHRIHKWTDIPAHEEKKIKELHDTEIDGRVVIVAYTEFDVRGTRAISFVSLFHKDRDNFILVFDLIAPGLKKGEADWRISLDIDYGKVDKEQLTHNVLHDGLIFIDKHPAPYEYTPERMANAKASFPAELLSELQTWFCEVIDILPEEILNPDRRAS